MSGHKYIKIIFSWYTFFVDHDLAQKTSHLFDTNVFVFIAFNYC